MSRRGGKRDHRQEHRDKILGDVRGAVVAIYSCPAGYRVPLTHGWPYRAAISIGFDWMTPKLVHPDQPAQAWQGRAEMGTYRAGTRLPVVLAPCARRLRTRWRSQMRIAVSPPPAGPAALAVGRRPSAVRRPSLAVWDGGRGQLEQRELAHTPPCIGAGRGADLALVGWGDSKASSQGPRDPETTTVRWRFGRGWLGRGRRRPGPPPKATEGHAELPVGPAARHPAWLSRARAGSWHAVREEAVVRPASGSGPTVATPL